MKAFATALLAAALSLPALGQDFSKVEIKTTKLTDTTYMLTGAGGTLGLSVGEDAVFLIDDQYAPMTDKITAAIKLITPKPVRFVLNTHWHGDHTGGNENMGKAGAILVAHDNVRKRMSSEQFIELLKMNVKASPKAALPVVTFGGTMSFHVNGEELRALHMPRAHTDGDAIVHFTRANTIHMGDLFFNGRYPFFDLSSGGSYEGVIKAVNTALAYANDSTKVIPGHGPLAGKAELVAYRDVLTQVRDRVATLIKQGKTKEQVVAAKPGAEWDATWDPDS